MNIRRMIAILLSKKAPPIFMLVVFLCYVFNVTRVQAIDATSYINNTDSTLNFSACATTGCGGRIGQSITISGTDFGTPTLLDVCLLGATNGCIRIGDYTVPAANISSWTATSITFTIPSGITAFGGTGTSCGASGSGLCVTQNGVSDAALEFWVFPDITSISPSGAGEAKEGDSITINGNRFGTATGTVVFQSCALSDVSASVGSWGDTSITVTVPSGIDDNDDSCNIKLIRTAATGSKTDTSNNFVVLPNITSLSVCTNCNTNAAREHAAGVDTEGVIMLNGNHFGTSQGANGKVEFTGGFGTVNATIHGTAEGACATAGWASAATSVCVEVPTSIANDIYTGTITLTRNDLKTNIWSSFRVLPRITSNNPVNGVAGDRIQINGNHFCQTGSCPTFPNRSTNADNIKFGSTQATDVLLIGDFVDAGGVPCSGAAQAWGHSEICVKVPATTPTGSQPTKIRSNTLYDSNTRPFTVLSTMPNDPQNLAQFKSDGATSIATGGSTNETSVVLKADISAGLATNIALQVEVKPVGTSFACSAGDCADAVQGTVAGGGACELCTSLAAARVTVSGLSDGTRHWQARVRNTTTNEYSNWVSFGGNSESATDFNVDTITPTITFPSGGTCTDAFEQLTGTSFRISWNLNESADGQVEYSTNSDLSSSTSHPTTPNTSATSHQITLSGLSATTTYYFKVKSRDAAGNLAQQPSGQPFCSFTTTSGGIPATGELTSVVLDATASATYNSILWKGSLNNGRVRFQLATSNNASGPWTFRGGATCTSTDWYEPSNQDIPAEITCASQYHNNHRYFRYKAQLCSGNCTSPDGNNPQVNDIVINWSP